MTGMLPLAMALGEDMQVQGNLSPKYAFHADRYQRMRCLSNPGLFRRIEIRAETYRTPPAPSTERGSAVMFSAGVDSFDVLYDHLPTQMALGDYQLTHGIFLFHFDQRSHERAHYLEALIVYQRLFADLGLNLISADYNLKTFYPESKVSTKIWHNLTHGAGLMSVGLLLGAGLKRMYLAASDTPNGLIDYGTSALTDHMMSSEHFEFVHEGFDRDRPQKIIRLVQLPMTYDTLRVCWWSPKGVQNCGRCHKCVRTMTTLAILDKLHLYSTFKNPLTVALIVRRGSAILEGPFVAENLRLARQHKKTGMLIILAMTLLLSQLRQRLKSLIQRFYPGFRR